MGHSVSVVVSLDSPNDPQVQRVLRRHWEFLDAPKHTVEGLLSPPDSRHYLRTEGLLAPGVSFFSARDGSSVVAVGALVEIDARHGEVKSMHTVAERRGEGLARAILERLLAVAREREYARVSLETGSMVDFAPAHALYAALGFVVCGPFASYEPSVHSTFMTLALSPNA